ncbi:MAG: glutamine--fructose-6-phosphate transaminase (isomerizing) [Alphaproteobacteria bacterium]|nr:glutamine--fructose-6-phosphate transaminase (isomerizing) [Alphaproteobacteria bacterium]
MCGIVGIVNGANVSNGLVGGLRNLEYRGYDSVGIATLGDGGLQRRRAQGKIVSLERKLKQTPIDGAVGIGHTRWATHGEPTERNAHPHMVGNIAVVHNGIIENFKDLRGELEDFGIPLSSQTDSEVIPALIHRYRQEGMQPMTALRKAMSRLEGQYAFAALMADQPGLIFAARAESPLALGHNDNTEVLVASDLMAFSDRASSEMLLENGDLAVMSNDSVAVFDGALNPMIRPTRERKKSQVVVSKGDHRHFMHKEIHEQPVTVGQSFEAYIDHDKSVAIDLPTRFAESRRIHIVGCGTSLYAGMVAQPWFEKIAGIPLTLEVASEFRYRDLPMAGDEAALFISQSGETADTLASLRMAKSLGAPIAAIVNVPTSAMAREADCLVKTHAGPEIGVASTKAFTAQLTALLAVAVRVAQMKNRAAVDLTDAKTEVVNAIKDTLDREPAFKKLARQIKKAKSAVFIGRGSCHAMAMEGALKLKEISYIHAEGFAAGELKHGPIALIDENVPTIVLAPRDGVFQKTVSNAQEVAARSGPLVVLSDGTGCEALAGDNVTTVTMPETDDVTAPFAYATAVQLLAYHTALAMGTDVDQPRNLAKSVTVE